MMDRQGIATAMVSLSSPSAHFLPIAERPALVFRDRQLSYRGLQEEAGRVGGLLRALGVRQGDRVPT